MFKLASFGFLIWSFFDPFYASIAYIILVILLEGHFLFLDFTKRPNLQSVKDKYNLTASEIQIFHKYYVFFRFPTTSSKTSETMSGFQLSTIIWVPWLLYNKLWFPAIFIGLNIFLANYLSKKLKPLHFAHFSKPKDPIFHEKVDLESVYDKVVLGEGINNVEDSMNNEIVNDYSYNDYFTKAKELFTKHSDYEEAILYYSKAIKLKSDFALAYLQRGFAKNYLKQYEDAISDFDIAIELKSKLEDDLLGKVNLEQAYWNRGKTFSILNEYQKALNDYNEVINLNNDFTIAYIERAYTKIALKDYKGAILDCNKAIELDNNNSDAYYNRAIAKGHLMQPQAAISDFDQVLKINPVDCVSLCERAKSKSNLGDFKGALMDCNEALEIDSSFHFAYLVKGISEFNLEKYDEAYNDWIKAYELGNIEVIDLINEYFEQ